jgi:hypothetical protein
MLSLADLQSNAPQISQAAPQTYQVPPTIQIGTVESLIGLIVFIFGLGATWATMKSSVTNLEKTISGEIKPVLTDLRDRFVVVEDRVESLWKDKVVEAHSPRLLNDRGLEILWGSGIKEIVDANQKELERIFGTRVSSTAYDVERDAIQLVMSLPQRSPEVLGRLKEGAFRVGTELDMVLLVGGIYLRDEMLTKSGFAETAPRPLH